MAPSPRILVVDDDEIYRNALASLLTNAGYRVVAASGFQEALKILEDGSPLDLLLTDLMMPQGINGYALARMALMRRSGLPVVYLTGFDVPTTEAMGPVLRKPVEDDALLAAVAAGLSAPPAR